MTDETQGSIRLKTMTARDGVRYIEIGLFRATDAPAVAAAILKLSGAPDDRVEVSAAALWRDELGTASPSLTANRTLEAFRNDESMPPAHREKFMRMARAALSAAGAAPDATALVERLCEALVDNLTWVLPLAKGYAALNRHPVNLDIIAGCEAALAEAQAWRDSREGK